MIQLTILTSRRFIRGIICVSRRSSLKVKRDAENKAVAKLRTFEHRFLPFPVLRLRRHEPSADPAMNFHFRPVEGGSKVPHLLTPPSFTIPSPCSLSLQREESSHGHLLLSFDPSTRHPTLLSLSSSSFVLWLPFSLPFSSLSRLFFLFFRIKEPVLLRVLIGFLR